MIVPVPVLKLAPKQELLQLEPDGSAAAPAAAKEAAPAAHEQEQELLRRAAELRHGVLHRQPQRHEARRVRDPRLERRLEREKALEARKVLRLARITEASSGLSGPERPEC